MDSTTTTAPKRVVFAPFHEVRLLPKQGHSETENEPGVPTVLAPKEPLNGERTGTVIWRITKGLALWMRKSVSESIQDADVVSLLRDQIKLLYTLETGTETMDHAEFLALGGEIKKELLVLGRVLDKGDLKVTPQPLTTADYSRPVHRLQKACCAVLAPVPEPLVVAPPPPITKTPAEPQPVKEQRKRTVGERTIHVSSESVCDDADVIESSKFIMSFYTNTFTAKITPKLDTDNGSDYLFFPRQLIMSTGDGMNVVLHCDKETDEMHSLLQNQLPLCYVEQAIVHPRHPSQMRVTLRDTSGPGVKYTVTGRRVGFMPRIDDAELV
jgi:hypothetical protein